MDVRDHTAASDCCFDESVKFFVAANCELQVARSDALDLQVLACVASQLEHFSCEILEDRSRVNSGSSSNTATSVNSELQNSVDSTNRELNRN